MDYLDLLKRSFHITWRYRALWIFGFLLALCSGGGGGGNFNPPGNLFQGGSSDGGDFDLPNMPQIDESTIITVVVGVICLIFLLVILSIVIRFITRTALIGMVNQIEASAQVTMRDGWRIGWSAKSWRVFLVSLVIGIPLFILSMILIILALSPLLLIVTKETGLIITGILLTVLAVLFIALFLIALNAVIGPLLEFAWRRTALDEQGVVASVTESFNLIRGRLKDVFIVWLIMFGLAIGWAIVSLVVVLPVMLIAVVIIAGIPAGLVYLVSNSWIGTAAAGIPLALLTLIVIGGAVQGFYLIYQSTIWTLTYLDIRDNKRGSDTKNDTPEIGGDPKDEMPKAADATEIGTPEIGEASEADDDAAEGTKEMSEKETADHPNDLTPDPSSPQNAAADTKDMGSSTEPPPSSSSTDEDEGEPDDKR